MIEKALKKHPLALYPHLEECVPPEVSSIIADAFVHSCHQILSSLCVRFFETKIFQWLRGLCVQKNVHEVSLHIHELDHVA